MKKIILLMSLFIAVLFVGCSKNDTKEINLKTSFNVATLNGPTGIGFVNMMEKSNHNFEILSSPDEVVIKLINGEVDIASVPSNLASVLYNKTQGEISVLAINTLGVLYVVETGTEINSIEDLKGKTILSTGKGATPEYVVNYILEKAGILNEVNIEFKSEHAELVSLLSEGKANIAILPQPFVTSALLKTENLRVSLDLTEEWNNIDSQSSMITGVLVARNEVINNNKKDLDVFLDEYKQSIEKSNYDIEKTAELTEEFNILPKEVAIKAIPECNITYIDGEEMKELLSNYLSILKQQNPKSIGENLPNADFYYKK